MSPAIHINNDLHGKIYIFKYQNSYIAGVITSANLTVPGLSKNHEWGVVVEDPLLLDELETQIRESLDYKNLSYEVIANKLLPAAEHIKAGLKSSPSDINASFKSILKHNAVAIGEVRSLSLEDAPTIHLKPWVYNRWGKNGRYFLKYTPSYFVFGDFTRNLRIYQRFDNPKTEYYTFKEKVRDNFHSYRFEEMQNLITALECNRIWDVASKIVGHPYLDRKQVGAFDVRQISDRLLIPLRDANGWLWSLQYIYPDGRKRFWLVSDIPAP